MSTIRFGGRYVASRLLKCDGGVSAFLGSDAETGRLVVIKTASWVDVSASARLRLEHEADVLRATDSPFLACMLEMGRQEGEVYVVMPFVPGVTLGERIRGGRLSTRDTLVVARGIMSGLVVAHEHGVLHRDVKPSNVIVSGSEPVEHVTLIDFGLAHTQRLESSIRDIPVGTAHYVSPEQAGLLHQPVDERSDLYSAGALLFECLAGRPPFVGDSVGDVLRQHATTPPPLLRGLADGVPTALDELVQRLLRKDPGDRYQSAEAARHDLCEIADALERGVSDPPIVLGLHERRRRTLTDPALIARSADLRQLERQLERVSTEANGLVLLESPSGGGKSRLLEELQRSTAREDVWVVRGQGRDQAAQRPFQVLDGVVSAVIERCRADEEFAERLRTRLAGSQGPLLQAIPELFVVLGGRAAPRALGEEQHGEVRTIRALAELLDCLGAPDRRALVMLDDCQWADELTITLLAHWHGADRVSEPSSGVLVVVAFRTEEVPPDHALRALEATEHVALAALRQRALGELVESMAGPVPREAIELIARLSEGSPFMAIEILRGLVETGAMVADDSGWQVVPELIAEVQASSRSAVLFRRRLEQAPDDVLDLLSVGAVLGKHFSLETAAEMAGQSPTQAIVALADARRRHIVWADDGANRCAFVHDKLREALLERLPDARRRALHQVAAISIEKRDRSLDFELAYHFDAAGEHALALPYAVRAAGAARLRYALEIAQVQYGIAARGATSPAMRQEIAEGMGDLAMLRGHYDDASIHLAAARDLCESDLDAARIGGRLGELAFKRGDVRSSADLVERALRLLGQRVPRRFPALIVMLLWQVVVQIAHSVAPRIFLARRSLEGAQRELLAIRLHSALAHAHWFGSGLVPCAWTHLRGMNLAERYPPTSELAKAYSEHAPIMTMVPWCERGIVYAERSLAIRRDLGDVWGEGQSLSFFGVVLYAAGRFEEVLKKCGAAVEVFERTGDRWEVNTANWNIALALYRLGRMEEAIAVARHVHAAGLALGDSQSAGISLGAWAKASGGAVPWDVIEAQLAHPADDVHTRVEVLQAHALRLISEDRIDEAVDVLTGADSYLRQSGLRQEYVAPVRLWLVTALRLQLERTSSLALATRRRRARRARTAARRARRLACCYRNNLPHALRESALLAATAGRPRRARRLLERSLAVATEQGARHERAQTLLAGATIEAALGRPAAHAAVDEGHRTLAEFKPKSDAERLVESVARSEIAPGVTLSLVDRFTIVLDAGRQIASALTEEAVFAAVREAATTLLRGECSIVVALDDNGRPQADSVVGDPHVHYSTAVIERAYRTGATVVVAEEDLRGDASDSQELGRTRSALCAPIFVRGHATACLYVTHDQFGELFGEEEDRLAAFISTLAGAALENAEGFSEVQALSVSLEQRVAERTEQLTASKERVEGALSILAATLDSTADGILVVDDKGTIVNYNRKFAEMWHIPEDVLESHDDERAIAFVLGRLRDPEQFLARVRELYAHPDDESHDEFELKDERVFERQSKPHRLGGKSIGRVWSFRDVSAHKDIQADLRQLADHDGLTGLTNRRRFDEELAREAATAQRYGGGLVAMLLDIDNFKDVNDTYGHKAGDDVIQSLAALLRQRMRETDVVARLGGDEFAVLLPRMDHLSAQKLADTLVEAVRDHGVPVGGRHVSMTVSIGVAMLGESDPGGAELLAEADRAMYDAKRGGRDRVSFRTAAQS